MMNDPVIMELWGTDDALGYAKLEPSHVKKGQVFFKPAQVHVFPMVGTVQKRIVTHFQVMSSEGDILLSGPADEIFTTLVAITGDMVAVKGAEPKETLHLTNLSFSLA
jgi:hypothetical protein